MFLWLPHRLGEGKLCWVPCSIKMGTAIKAALLLPLLLLLRTVWALDIPLEGESPHSVIQYKSKIFTLNVSD